MKKIRFYLILFFLISSVVMKLFGKETELIEKRNFTAKTYRLDDGSYKKVLSIRPMHYRDDSGNLIDIQKGPQYEDHLKLAIQQMNSTKNGLAKASSNRNFNDGGAYTEYNYQKMTTQNVQYWDEEDSCYYWRDDTTYSYETGYNYYGDLIIGFEIETNPDSLGPEGVTSEIWRSLLSWNTTGSGITEDGSVLIDTLKLVLGYYEAFNYSPDNFMIDVNSIGEYAITEEPTADDYALIADGDNILSADICTHNYPYDDSLVYLFTSGTFYDDFTYCWNNQKSNYTLGIKHQSESFSNYIAPEAKYTFLNNSYIVLYYHLREVKLVNEKYGDESSNLGGTLSLDNLEGHTDQLSKTSGTYVPVFTGEDYTVKTHAEYLMDGVDSLKHLIWGFNSGYMLINSDFGMAFDYTKLNAQFKEPSDITLSSNAGTLSVRDPWYVSDAQTLSQPDTFRTVSPGSYGVFLNQGSIFELQPPYYSLKAPQVYATASNIMIFENWTVSPSNGASFEDSTALETAVVFKSSGATVTAVYTAVNQIANYTLSIPVDETLTVPAGASISFADGFTIDVKGTLNITGTESSPVTLASTGKESGFASGGYGYLITYPPEDTLIKVQSSGASVDISNAVISNAYCGLLITGANKNVHLDNVEIKNTNIGILMNSMADNVVIIENSYIHDNDVAISLPDSFPNYAQETYWLLNNTVIANNSLRGIYIAPQTAITQYWYSILYFDVVNCTFYNNTNGAIFFGHPNFQYSNGHSEMSLYNNIFSTGSSVQRNGNIYTWKILDESNNDFYNSTANFTLSGTSMTCDPQMISPATVDFRLKSTSPCIDAGDNDVFLTVGDGEFELYTDPDGTDPDIGAYYFPQYSASGTISADTTWYGKVTVTGDVTVASGAELTIDPGSEIDFNSGKKITVNGALDVNGTSAAHIVFTRSDTASTSKTYWYGIYIPSGGSYDFDYFEMYGAQFGIYPYYGSGSISYGTLSDNYRGIITRSTSNLAVNNCTIKNGYYGIYAYTVSNMDVISTTIDSCSYGVRQYASSVEYTQCNVKNSTYGGIYVLDQSNIDMDEFYGYDHIVTNNRILNNSVFGVSLSSNTTANLGTYLDIGTDIEGGFNIFTHAASAYDVRSYYATTVLAQVNQWTSMNNYGIVTTTPTAANLGYTLTKSGGNDNPDEIELKFRAIYKLEHDSLYADALKVLNGIAASAPDHRISNSVINEMVRLYQKIGDTQGLIVNLDNLIAACPEHAVGIAALNYSVTVKAVGREYPEALNRSDRLIGIYDRDGVTAEQMAWAMYEQGWIVEEMESQDATLAKSSGKSSADIYAGILAKYPDTEAAAAIREMTGETTPEAESVAIPQKFALKPAYPNPFNPKTTIAFDLPEGARVEIVVYDLMGREVWKSAKTNYSAGIYSIVWNGVNHSGQPVGTGMYLVKLNSAKYTATQKVLLMK